MQTLFVERVEPYAPGDESASVALKSALGEIVVFCYPYRLKVGEHVTNRLSALDANACTAALSDWPEDEIKEKSKEWLEKVGPYAYRGCGHVLDQESGLIEVLGFHIELGRVPCNGAVEFECMRIDLDL